MTLHLFRHMCADIVVRLTGNGAYTDAWVCWHSTRMVGTYTHLDQLGREETLPRLDGGVHTMLNGHDGGGELEPFPVKHFQAIRKPQTDQTLSLLMEEINHLMFAHGLSKEQASARAFENLYAKQRTDTSIKGVGS